MAIEQLILSADSRTLDWSGADVLITDPPYSVETHAKAATSSVHRMSPGDYAYHNDLGFQAISEDLRAFTARVAASVKRWSVIFSDIESVAAWRTALESAGAEYIRTVPWIRWSMPQLSGDRPPQGWEAIILAHPKGRKRWSGPGNLTHCDHTCLRGKDKHKTEKPLDLMLSLVSWFSEPGETVIDPFAGAGTTGLAAKLLGRGFVGAEMQEEWARKASQRIASPLLSERDQKRLDLWSERDRKEREEKVRCSEQTAKARDRRDTADGT